MERLSKCAVLLLFAGLMPINIYVFGACSGASEKTQENFQLKADNDFVSTKSYDDTWQALNIALRKHQIDANKDTGIIRTETMTGPSDMYSVGFGSQACEAYTWIISVTQGPAVRVTVERDLVVYDAAYGSPVCNEVLGGAKSSVAVPLGGGVGMNVAVSARKSINTPKTSWRLENAAKEYLQGAVIGGDAGGRLPSVGVGS